ncbi:MAG TPA: class I SAM-dependent methyltransferase family protein [Candidatus Bathyarchaeia archaeon]|nr:class I SAM-dependent methyltransferase family protein [Candidatus Bathyarchaeia archaeon]
MVRQSLGIRTQKINGEPIIRIANQLEIIDRDLEIHKDEDFIYVPVARQPTNAELDIFQEQAANIEVSTYAFKERTKHSVTLAELLRDRLPPHLITALPHSADIVGDIAVIEIPQELESHKALIGEAVLKAYKNVKTVLAKAGAVSGVYRLREFEVIAGENRTETLHKEYECQYYVDVAKAYFSPRLSYEHNRVASLVKEDETVVDLFAGVGPFAVLIGKTHKTIKVYAVDVNPDAVKFLKRNTRLNRVENKVYPILGDARQIVEQRLSGVADRVIMNLPEKAIEFMDVACKALKPEGGVIHFYGFVDASNSVENLQTQFEKTVEKHDREVVSVSLKLVRATAPYEWQAVIDAKVI